MKTIGIVGSRRRATSSDFIKMLEVFDTVYEPGDRIISGGCTTGGDRFAEDLARNRGLSILVHFADWNGPNGAAAGFVRNTKIAEDCDILIALVADNRKGGVEDCIKKATKLNKKVLLC